MVPLGRLLLIGALIASVVDAADVLPADLVGEWATDASVFRGGALHQGLAMYLTVDGGGALIAAPPPIGARGPARYDAKARLLTLALSEHGQPVATCAFVHDRSATTLKAQEGACGNEIFRRRRDRVPEHILKTLR